MEQRNYRRDFFKTVAAGYTATALGYPANETIGIGCIGTGGRAQSLMRALESVKGARIAAICDIWDVNLAKAREIAGPAAFATKDYHDLLARRDVDAVLIGSPDHLHVQLTVAACEAGKDVYVEKPLTHDLSEGRRVIEAQNRNQRIVQVGMQQRSMPQFQKGYEIVKSGILGDIHKVHLTWNRNTPRWQRIQYHIDPKTVDWKSFLGPAKEQPFDEYKFRQWRWFWDFGGGIFTDLMVHYIDVVHWYLGVEHPSQATSIGDHFASQGVWETPDTVQTLLRYPDRELQVYFEGTFVNARNAAMLEFMGTDGTLYLDRGRYELYPERRRAPGSIPPEPPTFPYSEWVIGEGPRGADFYKNPNAEVLHLSNWIECVRSRNRPRAPAEAGVSAASAAHLANQALRSGEVARWQA